MNLCVNLLREDELRVVGLINKQTLIRASVAAVLLVIFATIGGIVLHYQMAIKQYAMAQQKWDQVQPIYDKAHSDQAELVVRRKLIAELKGWSNSRIEWSQPMIELQQIMPPTIQMTRFSIRSDLIAKEQRAPPAVAGQPPPPAPPAVTQRKFMINIFGTATGALADQVAIHFVRTFRQASTWLPVLESVKLASLQKVADNPNEKEQQVSDRNFEIEALCLIRDMAIKDVKEARDVRVDKP
jgi:hypothetical protein